MKLYYDSPSQVRKEEDDQEKIQADCNRLFIASFFRYLTLLQRETQKEIELPKDLQEIATITGFNNLV